MGSDTKAEALAKLRQMSIKIGHPDEWRGYAALDISPTDLLGNVLRARQFEADRQRRRMSAPVDKAEWRMTAPTVDAYYSPGTNEIAFPAGVLQPPLFDPAADDAYNYGSTGATIGHEIGHAFDSRGSRYDGSGNLRDWWSPTDRTRFDQRAASLVEQFNAYEPLAGHRISGQLTLPENMADLAGLEIAYDAYVASLGGLEPRVIDGLTGYQRFFIGYAQSYMGKRRDALLVAQLANNSHSPERYRVNGIVRNMAAFYSAFGVGPGDRMYMPPANRVSLWGGSGR
jgi:predicted metalloendopeptidase